MLPIMVLTSPASANWLTRRRIKAGLVPTLPAISDDGKGSVALASKVRIWTATAKRLLVVMVGEAM
ncbi:hypothetical protein CS8_068410 [Cupriavidus sp. 8B]